MKQGNVYKCKCCVAFVEVIKAENCDCTPDCCGEPMVAVVENTVDASKEKHVPVITKVPGGFKVAVGSVAHPMAEDHYIEWIELLTDSKLCRQYLKPGAAPEAFFACTCEPASVCAREHCNKHGLWKA
jgi:superoxide reductase